MGGRGLAPDGGAPDTVVLAEPLQSGASPLPHWNVTGLTDVLAPTMECHWLDGCTRFNCGRGLAPDGGVPDAAVLADPLQSGASPLPHWNDTGLTDVLASTVGGGKPFPHWNDTGPTDVLASTVGGGLPPMVVGQTQLSWLTPCNRGQPPLTLEFCLFLENGYAPTY